MANKGLIFWGYLDSDGKIEVKRYINDKQIQNYEMLPFVKGIFDPCYCKDIWEARKLFEERYRQELN